MHCSSRPKRLVAALALCAAGLTAPAAAVLIASSPAGATACGSAVQAGSNCTSTGTLTLSGGALSATSPSSLAWSGTVTGTELNIVDATAADQGYEVSDLTGTGNGWHVTVAATTFTTGSATLPDSGTFSTNGSTSSISATSAPSASCVTSGQCTLPTNTTTYPVAITTAATAPTAYTIYDTSSGTGLGAINIGGSGAANPVGWWLNVPANAMAGTYTSTITFAVVAAP